MKKILAGIVCIMVCMVGVNIVNAEAVYTRSLTVGSTGADVVALQLFLVDKGFLVFDVGVPAGYFGNSTKSALARFQASVGLDATGYFGPLTMAYLNGVVDTGITIEPVSSSASTYGSSEMPTTAEFYVTFKLGAKKGDVTVYSDGARFSILSSNNVVYNNVKIRVQELSLLSGGSEDRGDYLVKEGGEATFRLHVIAENMASSPKGLKLQLKSLIVGDEQGVETIFSQGIDEDFSTEVQYVLGATTTSTGPATSSSKINVVYPNGGESILLGVKDIDFKTTWSYSNVKGDVTLYIEFPDGRTCKIGNAPVTDKVFTTRLGQYYDCPNISSTLVEGKQYRVLVVADTNNVKDYSDSYFSVTYDKTLDPSITVISPNGGEKYKVGDTVEAKWSFKNLTSKTVAIDLYDRTTFYPVVSGISNTGKYQFKIPQVSAGSYKLSINSNDKGPSADDTSDNYFSITKGNVATPTTPTAFYVKVLSPNGGEKYREGDVMPITFTGNLTDKDMSGYTIQLYRGNPGTASFEIIKTIEGDWIGGSPYNWKVPRLKDEGEYGIFISANGLRVPGKDIADYSDRMFTIKAVSVSSTSTTPTTPTTPSTNYSAAFTSPTSAASVKAGSDIVVKGSVQNIANDVKVIVTLKDANGNTITSRNASVYGCSNNYCIGFKAATGIRITVPASAATGNYTVSAEFSNGLKIESDSFTVLSKEVSRGLSNTQIANVVEAIRQLLLK